MSHKDEPPQPDRPRARILKFRRRPPHREQPPAKRELCLIAVPQLHLVAVRSEADIRASFARIPSVQMMRRHRLLQTLKATEATEATEAAEATGTTENDEDVAHAPLPADAGGTGRWARLMQKLKHKLGLAKPKWGHEGRRHRLRQRN
jgi:hypothetical protein